MKNIIILLICIYFNQSINGQKLNLSESNIFIGYPIQNIYHEELSIYFKEYNLFSFDLGSLNSYIENNDGQCSFSLNINERFYFSLTIERNDISTKLNHIDVITQDGIIKINKNMNSSYKGVESTFNGPIRMNINKDFIIGFIEFDDEVFYIEQLKNFVSTDSLSFILYRARDLINDDVECALNLVNSKKNELRNNVNSINSASACKVVEIVEVADWSMVQKYGSPLNLFSNRIEPIINMVEGLFTPFNLKFEIVQEIAESCNCNTWTSTFDIHQLILYFETWAYYNSNLVNHDLGQLWTDRFIAGGVVGTANAEFGQGSDYGTCHTFKYNVVKDVYTANGQRTLCAHEIGHNFNAQHDSQSGYIMNSYIIQNATLFSSQSISSINSYLGTISCLSDCCEDNFESNNSCASSTQVFANALGTGTSNYTINGNIGYAGDQDWYSFQLASCGTMTISLSNLPYNYDMELYGTCGGLALHGAYQIGTANEQIVLTNTSSGTTTYRVKVYPNNSSSHTVASCYNLNFTWNSSSCCQLQAYTPTLISPGSGSSPGQTVNTTTPTFSWNGIPGAAVYGLYIRDVNSNVLVYSNDCATSNTQFTIPSGILSNNHQYKWNIIGSTGCGNTCVSGYPPVYYFKIELPIQSYLVTTSSNPSNGGITSGGGNYQNGQIITVSAISNPGYNFINWTENGIHQSSSSSFTFGVSQSYNLVANFSTCSYSLSSNSTSAVATATTGAFWVYTGSSCSWNASTTGCSGMITLNNTSGTGNGYITFNVTQNPSSSPRSCNIIVNGQIFSVNQVGYTSPCSVTPPNPSIYSVNGAQGYNNTIHVSWSGNTIEPVTYEVQRATNINGPFFTIAYTTSTSFQDVTATGELYYYYRVRSCCGNNCSSYSNTAGAQSCIYSTATSSIISSTEVICAGDSVVLTRDGGTLGTGSSWIWRTNQCNSGPIVGTGNSITVSPTTNTVYVLKAEGGCYFGFTPCAVKYINVNPLPIQSTITANSSPYIECGDSIILSGNSGGVWSNGEMGASITVGEAGDYFVTNSNSCGTTNSNHIIVSKGSCIPVLSLKLFIEGYYGSNGLMDNDGKGGCLFINDISNKFQDVDSIEISLIDPLSMGAVFIIKGILQIDGVLDLQLDSSVVVGNSYYIRIRHRSALDLWSLNPIILQDSTTYDFTTSQHSAFSNNIKVLPDGKLGVVCGDVDRNGAINILDLDGIEAGIIGFHAGYLSTDISGDGISESVDYSIVENNLGRLVHQPFSNVTICGQTWMTRNLNVLTYRNGDTIPYVSDPVQWSSLTTGAWCYYDNDPSLEPIYGKLYNWYAVNDARGLAPVGWHLPTDIEWTILESCLGGQAIAGGKMKETGTLHWLAPNTGATNSSFFSGLAGGLRADYGAYLSKGLSGYWWSATQSSAIDAWNRSPYYINTFLDRPNSSKRTGMSVRCLKD